MTQKPVKMIAASERNYERLKGLGNLTDSFDKVLTKVLDIAVPVLQQEKLAPTSEQVGGPRMSALEASTTQGASDTSSNE